MLHARHGERYSKAKQKEAKCDGDRGCYWNWLRIVDVSETADGNAGSQIAIGGDH